MVTIYDYVKKIIGTAPLNMNGTASDPAKAQLFMVDKLSPLFSEKEADFPHSMTAGLVTTKRNN